MRRLLYALRLWAWFAARDSLNRPFVWFLHQYDKRQENFRGEFERWRMYPDD